LAWSIGDRSLIEDYANKPDWLVLKVWGEVKKRKLEEINHVSRTPALLCAIAVNALSSFGGGESEAKPDDFLPFRLEEDNSPKAQLRKKLKPSTIEILNKLLASNQIPPQMQRAIVSVEGMKELISTIVYHSQP
jgi:hypothetical protein